MKKVKLNDKVMKKEKYVSDDAKEIKSFIIILVCIIVGILIVYGLTTLLKKDDESKYADEVTAGEINYDKVIVGTMLGKSDSEYYVMVYDDEDPNAILYSTIITKYQKLNSALPIYFCDLGNKLNESYIADGESNPNAKTIDDLKFGDLTLIKVKKGKINKYIEELDTIKSELGV